MNKRIAEAIDATAKEVCRSLENYAILIGDWALLHPDLTKDELAGIITTFIFICEKGSMMETREQFFTYLDEVLVNARLPEAQAQLLHIKDLARRQCEQPG